MTDHAPDALEQWREFAEALRRRPRMYVLDERYLTVCAALTGFDAGRGERLLADFSTWLGTRHPPIRNRYFPALVVADALEEADRDLATLTADEEARAKQRLFELLDTFLAESEQVAQYSLTLPPYFDEVAYEIEAKGYFADATLAVGDRRLRPVFYDPVRLAQDVEGETRSAGFFCERTVIVVERVTRSAIEAAVERLARGGFGEIL